MAGAFAHFRQQVPADWKVIVLADRGLYAQWLFNAMTALGWHPFLRVNTQGKFRPQGQTHWVPFITLIPTVGRSWQGQGTAFSGKKNHLSCTLLGTWSEGYSAPWLIVTDLSPGTANIGWYGFRAWIEHGFKILKRGGWQWQYTRMRDPARAERLWLALARATWWSLAVGGDTDADADAAPDAPTETWPMALPIARSQGRHNRLISVFRQGWFRILAALLTQ